MKWIMTGNILDDCFRESTSMILDQKSIYPGLNLIQNAKTIPILPDFTAGCKGVSPCLSVFA
jgi:hypothetical protein